VPVPHFTKFEWHPGANRKIQLTPNSIMPNRIRFVPATYLKKNEGPNHGNLVWVQCREYRCLAYLNNKGNWINFYNGEKLNDFVKVIAR
jgi:hypothetical protein